MTYNFKAKNLAREVNFKKLGATRLPYTLVETRRQFLVFEIEPKNKLFFVFTFGIAVFVNLTEEDEKTVRKHLAPYLVEPFTKEIVDDYVLEEGTEDVATLDGAKIKDIDYHDIELTARTLAQSIELDYFDETLSGMIKKILRLQKELQKKGRLLGSYDEPIQVVAHTNTILGAVVHELSLLDKPEIAWEDEAHQQLYFRLAEVFDIEDRFRSLEYKVSFIRGSSEFIIQLLQSRRSERLEVIIIILIVIEIVLTVGQMLNLL